MRSPRSCRDTLLDCPWEVLAGRPYSGQITEAIRRTEILLVVLSQASNRSKQVLREVERAAHFKVALLAFKIESVEPLDDLVYFLGVEHWLDGCKPGPLEQHFPSLVRNAIELMSARKRQSTAQEQSSRLEGPEAERFAHFRILRRPDGSLFRLGKGGMGVTYKAIDTRLDKPVALKVIGAELLNSPQARRRFAPVEAFAQLERSAYALRAVGCNVGFRLRARIRLGQRQRPKDSGLLPGRDLSGDLSCPGSWKCRAVVELLSEAQSPLYCSALVTQPGRVGQANVGSRQPGVVDDPGRGRNSWHEIRLAFRPPHLRIA